jgi:hypothetical protein
LLNFGFFEQSQTLGEILLPWFPGSTGDLRFQFCSYQCSTFSQPPWSCAMWSTPSKKEEPWPKPTAGMLSC